jgi:hypothetical protein
MALKVAAELELSFREQAFRPKAPKFLNFSDHLRIYHFFFLCILVKIFAKASFTRPILKCDLAMRFGSMLAYPKMH